MSTLHYALNHTRKVTYDLGKVFSFYDKENLPKTPDEMYAHIWSQMDPADNFVDKEWGTPENAKAIAVALWDFGVEDSCTSYDDELIQEKYADYVIVGSVHTNDPCIGELMDMDANYDAGTMAVQTHEGYKRRKISYIKKSLELDGYYSSLLIPELFDNERVDYAACGRIPVITLVQKTPMDELEELHDIVMSVDARMQQGNYHMSIAEENAISRYKSLMGQLRRKHNL